MTPLQDPQWYKDAVVYEVPIKSFFDSNADGIGDFSGLIQKLDYLKALGVNCIWLLPFYPSPLRDDGYDIAYYQAIHDDYGTLRDFRTLMRQAHERGIRVITELVINHTSDQHPWFQRARKAPPGSPERDFYVWSDNDQLFADARIIFVDSETSNWTWDNEAKAYYWHRFFFHQPDLNFDNPAVIESVVKVMRFWLDLGVDGLRLDAIPYLIEREGTNCENLPETHAILKELRRQVDARYQNRMLLAEANQWPVDVRHYFGDGDECHMAFHFPVMPRIFMALHQEDRHPITEIMARTPDIPENCQWALFLRNHDELTLEMVTDAERDYMYRAYAAEKRMRINIGIRRRLASLMNNSRRRIELLHSLLLSLPGTPFIYYGDEIGMGDNIYLGDRDGVRTPMQWSGERNAGFSRADPARLYAQPIMDPVHGYQAVNVEAQQRDPSSLLNWMKQIIALRNRSKTFGRGSIHFLRPTNRKILAYTRNYENETILVVANLSRFSQPAELDLAEHAGLTPVEMMGNSEFPPIGELPYFVTLGPHAFFWFRLQQQEPQSVAGIVPIPLELTEELPEIAVHGGWETTFEQRARQILEWQVLPPYMVRQRWFAGKAREIKALRLLDWPQLHSELPPSFLVLVEVTYQEGDNDVYLLPLGVAQGPGADELRRSQPGAVLARLKGPWGHGILHDALVDDAACESFLEAIATKRTIHLPGGTIQAFPSAAFADARGRTSANLEVVRDATEQSNSLIRFGRQLVLKIFRRLETGLNPDYELGRFLTDQTTFDHIAQTAGAVELRREGEQPITLAQLQGFVPHQATGWDHAVDEVGRFFERALRSSGEPKTANETTHPLDLANGKTPELVATTVSFYLESAATLGRRTAQMHQALASPPPHSELAPEKMTQDDLQYEIAGMKTHANAVLQLLSSNLSKLEPVEAELANQILQARPRILQRFDTLGNITISADKIRCHGDFHLGQVLWTKNDFVFLDFEGEPSRPLQERRLKKSPLRDIAGMVQSFSYAAYTGLFAHVEHRPDNFALLEPWTKLWRRWTAATFLKSYFCSSENAEYLPQDQDLRRLLLDVYILDKALYELAYELNSRPQWVRIPLNSLVLLLAQKGATLQA